MSALNVSQLKRLGLTGGKLGCCVVSADGSIVFGNAAFCALLGYGADVLSTLNLIQLTSSDTAAQLRHNAIHDALGVGLDCSLVRGDGTPIWVHAVASLGSNLPNGEIVLQVVGIERQKAIEAALALSESRLNFALEAAGQGVWDHDIPTDTMFYSPGWRQMRGIAPDEEVNGALEAWLARIHPDDRGHIHAEVKLQNTGHEAFRVLEYREQHRNGHFIWIQSRGRPVAWNENGLAIRTLGTDTDITKRKESELQFQVISRRLELALEVSQIGVWEQDLDTGHVIWDRRMHEIYGRGQRDEALSEHDWEFAIHPADRNRAKHEFSSAVQNRSDYTSEFRIVLPEGNIRHIRSRGRYFTAALGRGKLIGAEWDITHDVERTEQLYDARLLAEARFNELQMAQNRIRHAAMHDHLTDLPNRRFLDHKLAEQLPFVGADGRRMALLHIDLDWFKQINDRFGHAVGDFMLQHVADILRQNARNDDFIARVGGDEFVLLSWFGDSDASLRSVASSIIEALTKNVPHDGLTLQIGASIGIAYAEDASVSATTLLQRADVALYRAKALGRNRYELATAQAA
ncbi:diguanylate cyclase (GGDEF)-like protein/PAS domain S-box-containing protein [Devosia sp. UYZn731]|uniref:sensor domain-containing protein n=1 Tax=Devosia sp. UYZn731 TaxID=3156345 RepID=UPI003397579F